MEGEHSIEGQESTTVHPGGSNADIFGNDGEDNASESSEEDTESEVDDEELNETDGEIQGEDEEDYKNQRNKVRVRFSLRTFNQSHIFVQFHSFHFKLSNFKHILYI